MGPRVRSCATISCATISCATISCATILVIVVGACSRPDETPSRVPPPIGPSRVVVSTIAAGDYIGPAACGECHPDQHALWSRSLHGVMNQRAGTDAAVIGDFDGARVAYAGGEARFDHDRDGYTMTLAKGATEVRYRVTRTIGRRGLQEYVGTELGGSGDEVRLPFGWWPRRAGWYPQPYFDPWFAKETDFDAYTPVREPWAERCPWCHSTYPFEQRIARAQLRSIGHGLEQHFAPAGQSAPGSPRLGLATQVTTGISCESCHLGGRAHADGGPIHFVPEGAEPLPGAPVPTTFTAERHDPAIVNAVCAQCHSGPSPRLADGTALRNSSEALDLAASPCTTARCIDCHDPHRGGADEARAITACTKCHAALADPALARAHAGHTSATCLDCHMPRMVMGIDRIVRTHRISSPTDPAVLGVAGPNACNLCHVDRSIRWTTDELRARFDVALDPEAWTAAYGDPDLPLGDVWLTSAEPALRLLATSAYARSPLARMALPSLVRGLADPLPHLRVWTLFAIEDVLRRRLSEAEFDPRAPAAERSRQLARLRSSLR